MKKNYLGSFILSIVFWFAAVSIVFARSGCCSWHGGVAGCSSSGRQVCNDGTLSPSCTCSPPVQDPPMLSNFPDSQASSQFSANADGTYDVTFDWDRPDGHPTSIAINKVAGANPGPTSDTSVSKVVFKKIKPGRWYVNAKELLPNGYWSNIAYWTVDVPKWEMPVPSLQPSPFIPSPLPKVSPIPQSTSELSDSSLLWLAGLVGGAFLLGRRSKNRTGKAEQNENNSSGTNG